MAQPMTWKQVAEALWSLLDDIDTAGDMAKSDDKAYRAMVEKLQRRRCEYLESPDGHRLKPVVPILE